MTPEQKTLAEHMLKALESPLHALTKWEEDFIESVTEQLSERGHLSERQMEIVERIYAEKTA